MESIVVRVVVGVLLGGLGLLGGIGATPSPAHALDMSAELEEYNAVCFDEAGEWLKTDGCIRSAESLGIEIDNLLESERKGCVLSEMFEDYSCKGEEESEDSSSLTSSANKVSEQGVKWDTTNELSSTDTQDVKGCFVVPADDPD